MANHTDTPIVDLEIRIFRSTDDAGPKRGYPVEITLGGQQEFAPGLLDADILPWTSSGDPAADGQRLFEAFLADAALRSAWDKARTQAPHCRIRLRIDPTAAELHALPWELLTDGPAMLSAQATTPFSRYLPIALPWSEAAGESTIRILVAISNPNDLEDHALAPVDVNAEREILKAAFATLDKEQIEAEFLDAPVTLKRLEDALRDGYHVLHFVGHGAFSQRRGQAALYLQDEAGHTHVVHDSALVSMLARQSARPQLVTLMACQSATRATTDAFAGLGPKLVSVGVPAVIAMQDFVTIETARTFESTFYQRLLKHGYVDQAMNEARSTLLTAERSDAAVPVLFMRLKSGQLWGTEADARGEILGTGQPKSFWSTLVRQIQKGRCTPIIGPRVHGQLLPTQAEIAERWADLHDYPFRNRNEMARVAQFMATSRGEDFPRCELSDTLIAELTARLPEDLRPDDEAETLTELVQTVEWQNLVKDNPNDAHRVLADLDLSLYLTTNPDSFMVEALKARGREPVRELCRWSEDLDWLESQLSENKDYEPSVDAPLVYHFFGSDEEVDSLALTEDHYFNFLVRTSSERDRIPYIVRDALSATSLMFIGYSLYDWEFRVLMHGLVNNLTQRRKFKHVAVQLELDDVVSTDTAAVQTFLQQYFQDADINVYWGSTAQFVAELREQWEKR
ncbi:MAG: CHAT domain-containing protein [Anaerolineae bacterium]|nr:CHAT domain-containing protein [Anaerolineae bacterium]